MIEIFSIASSISSIILSIVAIALSVYFFVQSRNTDKNVSVSLSKIESQSEMLQKITGKQVDRLTRFVTEDKNQQISQILPNIIKTMQELPSAITESLNDKTTSNSSDELLKELISCYIALYFYITQTNFWSQFYLPKIEEYDDKNELHNTTKRIVDMSSKDFELIANILFKVDQTLLTSNALSHLLFETRDYWKDFVKDSTQVYSDRSKQ
jgi:hypothetical protein